MNKEKRLKMMREEKIPKVLIKLALPAIIGMLLTAIYNIVDTLFVSMLGTKAIGAISVVYPLFLLLTGIGLMYGMGSASFVSRLLGEKRNQKANEVASTTFITSIASAFIVTFLLLIFLIPILKLFGATDTIMPFAFNYGKILSMGAIFTIINMVMNNLLRAEGSAKYSMIALATGALLNIALDPIFIFTLGLGIKGAAIATVLAQSISTILLLSFFVNRKSLLHISIKHFKPSKSLYKELYKIGIPTFIRQFLMSISMGMINTAASPYGDAAIASMGITARVFSLVAMIIFGYSQGFQPIAGFSYGANNIYRLKEAIKSSITWTVIFCTISSIIYIVFAPQIIGIFSSDPSVIDIGIKALRAIMIMFPLFGFQTIYATLFQALGKGKQAALLSLSRQGIFLIPTILILPSLFGINGVLFSQPVADLLTIILTGVFAYYIHKQLNALELKNKLLN